MEIEITTHAINRYQERVKPSLPWSAARRELYALVRDHGRVLPSIEWVTSKAPHHVALMEISDGVALTLSNKLCQRCEGVGHGQVAGRTVTCTECKGKKTLPIYVATSILVRGGMDERHLERKRAKQARRRWRRRIRRHKPRHDGRGIPDPDYDQ